MTRTQYLSHGRPGREAKCGGHAIGPHTSYHAKWSFTVYIKMACLRCAHKAHINKDQYIYIYE